MGQLICLIIGHDYEEPHVKWVQCSDLVVRQRVVRTPMCKRCYMPLGVELSFWDTIKNLLTSKKEPF